jgi:transcriptional regulator with XRE-family HTH domain
LNITDRQLRRIEKGESGSSVDLLIELACVFEVSLDYLILGNRHNEDKEEGESAHSFVGQEQSCI